MTDTLPNIRIIADEWIDLYAESGIPVGTKILVENTGVCDVSLAVQASKPSTGHGSFNIVKRTGGALHNHAGDSGAWAFCGNTDGQLNVSEMAGDGFIPFSPPATTQLTDTSGREAMVSMIGESHVGFKVDDISVNFQYGISTRDISSGGSTSGTGAVGTFKSMATLSSGVGIGEAELLSLDTIRYRAGHECHCAQSIVFGEPEAGVDQFAGFLNGDDGWCFGYQGLVFGLWFIEGSVEAFIPQSSFSQDKIDGTGPSGYNINPQTGQLYRLSYAWHGFLDLQAEIRTSAGQWVPVHKVVFVNSAIETHLENPNLPAGVKVRRVAGSGAGIVISTGSWRAGVISGPEEDNGSNRWFAHTVLDFALAGVVRNNVFTIRNKATYQGKINHIIVELGVVTFDSTANKTVAVFGTKDATLAGNGPFVDIDTVNSVLDVSEGGTLTGGTQGPATVIKAGGDRRTDVLGTGIKIYPGESFTFEVDPGGPVNGGFSISARIVEYH